MNSYAKVCKHMTKSPVEYGISRRSLLLGAGAMTLQLGFAAPPAAAEVTAGPSKALLTRALAAMDQHRAKLTMFDKIGIADFGLPSRHPRFHLIDLVSGKTTSLLVAHGRGSDLAHSGWLERFSNTPGSAASSRGSYVTGPHYVGQHGRSRRLLGLDPENNNAERRAIVIHAAEYVGTDFLKKHGKLGRSEGCFAFAQDDIDRVLTELGSGRLIFADKLST
jgi:hypothetical protein